MANYPVHFIQIRDKLFKLGDNIEIEEDFDYTYKIVKFDFPDTPNDLFDVTSIKKYDTVNIFFNSFEQKEQADSATFEDCKQVFNGYVDLINCSESKAEGLSTNITCKSTFGLVYDRTTITKAFNDTIPNIILKGLQETGLYGIIPYAYVSSDIDEIYISVTSEYNFGMVIDEIKKTYPIKIFQNGDGGLWITSPSFFQKTELSSASIKTLKPGENPTFILSTWEYDLNTNITNINYGEETKNYNCVACYGLNTVGAAYDPIGYELQFGTSVITPENLSVLPVYRRDLLSNVECRKFAYETLVDLNKNYTVTFDSYYKPVEQLGDSIKILSSRKINPEELWTIKRRVITISKNNINSNITVYRTGIADLESSALAKLTELLQIDILNVQDKLEAAVIANNLGE